MLHLAIQLFRFGGIIFFVLMLSARATGFLVRFYKFFWGATLVCFGLSILLWLLKVVMNMNRDEEE
jgi:hypothetical protein